MSLNGKIARTDGEVDWLDAIPNPNQSDYGYYQFYDSIDTTIQGYNTYQKILDWGVAFPYADKKNYVFTRQKGREDNKDVRFILEDHLGFVERLKQEDGKDIWLIGGGQVNTLLLNAGLIDQIHVHIMPIIIPDGISLFEALPKETMLSLKEKKIYDSGVVELMYQIGGH